MAEGPGAFRFEGNPGIQHEHTGAALQQGMSARHTGRAGADDTMQKTFFSHSTGGLKHEMREWTSIFDSLR